MKQYSSIKSKWKASVNFLTSNFPQQRALKTRALKKASAIFSKKAKFKAYLFLRARATEWNFYPQEQEHLSLKEQEQEHLYI